MSFSIGGAAGAVSGSRYPSSGGGGGDLWGSIVSAVSAERANHANRKVMYQQYQREDEAYQRAVIDMRKAGLNPALMFGHAGPSSSGGGAIGRQESVLSPEAVNSGLATARLKTELDFMRQQTRTSQAQERVDNQAVSESEAREALTHAQRNIVSTEDAIKRAQLPRERNRGAVESTKFGKFLAYLDRGTDSIGGIINAVLPSLAAGKGLFMAKKYLQQQEPLERARSAHEHAYASERGRIDAREARRHDFSKPNRDYPDYSKF